MPADGRHGMGILMSNTDPGDAKSVHGMIIAKAWSDPAFKAKLLADPHAALKELGVAVSAGKTVKVVENADRQLHLVLPPKPAGQLSADEADRLSADRVG
jgi:nitrile hydratase alpha subunit